MADLKKISALPSGTPASGDYIPFVDIAAGVTKKGLKSDLVGATGATGSTGGAGTSATATAGTTTTGAPGTSATVTNVGTVNDAVFDFTIPRGDVGIQGIQGIQGDPGSGTGDVVGPASAVADRVVTFNGTTGKLIKDSGLTLSGSNTGDNTNFAPPLGADDNYVTDAQKVVIGNTSGTNTGDQTSVSGNAGTATALQTARNIAGVSFNGTANIAIASTNLSDTASIVLLTSTQTLTNKRRTRRLVTVNAPGATPTTNTDNVDVQNFTGLAAAITSMTTNLSGTPVDGDLLEFRFTDDGTPRAITWGASFVATTVALPIVTVTSTMLRVGFEWNGSVWQCVASC